MQFTKKDYTVMPSPNNIKWLNPNAQVIYMWLSYHSNDNDECFPSHRHLAQECWMSEKTVQRMLKLLEMNWKIIRTRRFNNNEETTSMYKVLYEVSKQEEGVGSDCPQVGSQWPTELNKFNIEEVRAINEKILNEDERLNYQLWNSLMKMFDLWYCVYWEQWIKDFVKWSKSIMQKYIWTTNGDYPYSTFENVVFERYTRHSVKFQKDKYYRINNYLSSLLTFFKNKYDRPNK